MPLILKHCRDDNHQIDEDCKQFLAFNLICAVKKFRRDNLAKGKRQEGCRRHMHHKTRVTYRWGIPVAMTHMVTMILLPCDRKPRSSILEDLKEHKRIQDNASDLHFLPTLAFLQYLNLYMHFQLPFFSFLNRPCNRPESLQHRNVLKSLWYK